MPVELPGSPDDRLRSSSVDTSHSDPVEKPGNEQSSKTSIGSKILSALSAVGSFLSFPFRWAWSKLKPSSSPTTEKTADVGIKTLVAPEILAEQLKAHFLEHPNLKFDVKVFPEIKVVAKDENIDVPGVVELIEQLGGTQKVREIMVNNRSFNIIVLDRYDAAVKDAEEFRKDNWHDVQL